MNVAAPDERDRALNSDKPEPFYFGSGGDKLFGWLHQPSGSTYRNVGLVICQPFGYEAICSHSSVRAFAEASAAVGVPALRFDYLGTGDSADVHPQANQLDVWAEDVLTAIEELRRRTGVQRVSVLGIRLGALLATIAAKHCDVISSLVLISPIISGRRHVREYRTTQLASAGGAESAKSSAGDGSMEVSGYTLAAATIEALVQFDAMTQEAPPTDMLIIDGSSMPVARRWAESLSESSARIAGEVRTHYLALPGLIEMLMTMPHDAKPPDAMLSAVQDWLLRVPAESSHVGQDTAAPATVLELPGAAPTPDALLTERLVSLACDPSIFGIVTEPCRDEKRRRAVVLVNAGATYHTGPSRVYVSLARSWARCGYFVLRMDLSGLGDSDTRSGRPDNEVYPPSALDDIRTAIEFVRARYSIDDLTICGFCSGAYHALRAAVAGMPVNCILMVNLENFYWKQDNDLHALEVAEVVRRTRDHRERIFSIAAWKRLMTGQVNIWRIVRIYIQRPLLAVESTVRDWARNLRIRLPRDVGWELEEIAGRGVHVVFAFARGEAGIDMLRIQAGSSVKRLGTRCRVHLIDSADHIFSQAGPRAALEKILIDELLARNR